MILEKYQREQLQNILSSPDFKAVEFFLNELARDIGVTEVMDDNEWNYTKESLRMVYWISLLKQLPELLEKAAADGGDHA